MMPSWSLLPEDLLHSISQKLDNCCDVVHARSVCSSWRSTVPFPACLLRPTYSLPTFANFPLENEGLCTLEKVPLFLFSVQSPPATSPCEYFIGGISRDESDDHMELPSPPQCTVKVKIPGSEPALVNMLDCKILPLGYQYRMIGWDPKEWRTTNYRGVAFIPLNKEGGEFIVLLNYTNFLLVLKSAEMKWVHLSLCRPCQTVVAFRGRFYASVRTLELFVIDPDLLEVTPLLPLQPRRSNKYLVPCGDDDELFLVEHIIPEIGGGPDKSQYKFRVSRLDEEAGKWVDVNDIRDRVFCIGHPSKELPDGCGVSGNSLLDTRDTNVTYTYKYGVNTVFEEGDQFDEDDLNFWRLSGESHVKIHSISPVVGIRVER